MTVGSSLLEICRKYLRSIKDWCFPRYKDISREIVLVTGGGRGLGRKLALRLARCKPRHIVLWGRTEECLKSTRDEIESLGVPASYNVCDVSNREQIYQKAQEVRDSVGDVTLLVNNAGVVYGGSVLGSPDEDIVKTLQVNALAHVWTIKAFLPTMLAGGRGHIVCMSSMLGLLALKGTGSYSAAKYATTGLMESLRAEVEEHPGLQLTTIHPYQIANDMFAGAHVRFPWAFPPLSEDYVVEESIKAILTNRKQLILPSLFHPVLFLKSLLPSSCLIPAFKFLGLDKTMDAIGQKSA